VRIEALGRLHEPAAVASVASRQLHEQADPGAHPFGLILANVGAPQGSPDRPASHLARLLRRAGPRDEPEPSALDF
jgi:hypothetical protein